MAWQLMVEAMVDQIKFVYVCVCILHIKKAIWNKLNKEYLKNKLKKAELKKLAV